MNPLLQKFKTLHQQLQVLLSQQDTDQELLQQKVMKYIAYMAEDHRNSDSQENLFDFFCENNGVSILSLLLRKSSFIAIKAFSLLFINLKDEIWVNFILCQPFVKQAIESKCDADEQEWTEYYISFLKSLSIRLSKTQIPVFYNKKSCTYPIVFEAMKYFKHPDFMVRTGVMNIILELMKIEEADSLEYFSRFPFTSYLITFSCEVYELVYKINKRLISQDEEEKITWKYLENYSVDLSDYLYYFNDLINFGTTKAVIIIRNAFEAYLIKPLLRMLMSSNIQEVKHAILVLAECLKVIKDHQLSDSLVVVLLSPQISKQYVRQFQETKEVYIPLVYQQKSNPQVFYWNRYRGDIIRHCRQVFHHIQQFEVEEEHENSHSSPEFREQVQKMSSFISYDLLQNQILGKEYSRRFTDPNDYMVSNPFRQRLLQLLLHQDELVFAEMLELILIIVQNKFCSKSALIQVEVMRLGKEFALVEESGLLLSPFQQKLKDIILERIIRFDWNRSPLQFLQMTVKILKLLVAERLLAQVQVELISKYKSVGRQLLDYVTKQNINDIVENFQRIYQNVMDAYSSYNNSLQISFVVGLLCKENWGQKHSGLQVPIHEKDIIVHHIHQYWLYRAFLKNYLENHCKAELIDFEEEYLSFFQTKGYQVNHRYLIMHKKAITCELMRKEFKKPIRVALIEDPINFMVAQVEPDSKNCKILMVVSWISVTFQMNRDDPTKLQTTVADKSGKDSFTLIFDDQVRSSNALVGFNDVKWARYEQELYFIYKFLNRTLNGE